MNKSITLKNIANEEILGASSIYLAIWIGFLFWAYMTNQFFALAPIFMLTLILIFNYLLKFHIIDIYIDDFEILIKKKGIHFPQKIKIPLFKLSELKAIFDQKTSYWYLKGLQRTGEEIHIKLSKNIDEVPLLIKELNRLLETNFTLEKSKQLKNQ